METKLQPGVVEAFCPNQEQWQQVQRAVLDGFGQVLPGTNSSEQDHLKPHNRRVAVRSTEGIFGGCVAYDFKLSMPGGTRVPVAGLSGVSISPPLQGNGGLRKMMDLHLQQSLELGDAASVLMASESGLYRRYGYGVATEMVQWHLPFTGFSMPPQSVAGYCVRLLHSNVISTLKPIYDEALDLYAGGLGRSVDWWKTVLSPSKESWVSAGAQFVAVVYSEQDIACGYALYKVKANAETSTGHGRVNGCCIVSELVSVRPEAQAALFNYLSGIGMTRSLIWEVAPVDPVVRHYMKDPRQLWQQARVDMMWLRPIDLPALFCSRSYTSDGELLIDYSDPVFDHLCKVWRLSVNDGRAAMQCIENVDEVKNTRLMVTLDSAALGSVLLGGTRVVELATAGLIQGTEEAIRLFDHLLLCDSVPFNVSKF